MFARALGADYFSVRETQDFIAHHPLVKSKLIQPLKAGQWPANSPDLNPIENLMVCVCVFVVRVSRVWLLLQAIVKRRVNKRLAKLDLAVPRTPELYLQYLKEEWGRTPEKTLRNLVDSMPKRCASCIARHGEITDY